ncbi:MAG: DUF1801 domain-containing protein [Myxococcales bacterium]
MYEPKTKPTAVRVSAFLNAVENEQRRKDAKVLLGLMKDLTGEKPRMWGPTMVGFGEYHYVYDSGHEGTCFMTGFSPRKDALTVYFSAGFADRFRDELERLGKAKASKACLYIKKLDDVDLDVLSAMLEADLKHARAMAREMAKKKKK